MKRKYYKIKGKFLHRIPLLGLAFFFVSTLVFILLFEPNALFILLLSISILFLLLSVVLLIAYADSPFYPKEDNGGFETAFSFQEGTIRCSIPYKFKWASLTKDKGIEAKNILEVNSRRWPLEVVLKTREIIFIPNVYKNKLLVFCKENKIPIVDRFDIWEAISRPYLDTEIDADEDAFLLQQLKENGLDETAVLQIRKKVRFMLLMRSYYSMNWVHYGHEDVIEGLWPSKKNYWWTMEIALKNLRAY